MSWRTHASTTHLHVRLLTARTLHCQRSPPPPSSHTETPTTHRCIPSPHVVRSTQCVAPIPHRRRSKDAAHVRLTVPVSAAAQHTYIVVQLCVSNCSEHNIFKGHYYYSLRLLTHPPTHYPVRTITDNLPDTHTHTMPGKCGTGHFCGLCQSVLRLSFIVEARASACDRAQNYNRRSATPAHQRKPIYMSFVPN